MARFCEYISCKHYIYLSSEDSKDVFPTNTMTDFVIELPEPLPLAGGHWEMALMEASYDKNIHNDHESVFLLCDVCEYSQVHNSSQPILRKLKHHPSYRVLQHFVDIKQSELKRIHFRMVDTKLQPIVYSGSFYFTLLLQKKDL